MYILRFIGIAVITAVLAVTVRTFRPELGMQAAAAGGVIILAGVIGELAGITDALRELMAQAGLDDSVVSMVFRITGIAYTAQLASDICTDAGERALASKAEICGRLAVVTCSLPMLVKLLTALTGLIGELL